MPFDKTVDEKHPDRWFSFDLVAYPWSTDLGLFDGFVEGRFGRFRLGDLVT